MRWNLCGLGSAFSGRASRSPRRNGSNHHANIMPLCLLHHALDVVRSDRELPSGIDVIGAGQDMHGLWLQVDHIGVETRGNLGRRCSTYAHVEPLVFLERRRLPRPAFTPALGDRVAHENDRGLEGKVRSAS